MFFRTGNALQNVRSLEGKTLQKKHTQVKSDRRGRTSINLQRRAAPLRTALPAIAEKIPSPYVINSYRSHESGLSIYPDRTHSVSIKTYIFVYMNPN